MARASTQALTKATLPFVISLADKDYQQALVEHPHFAACLIFHADQRHYAAEAFGDTEVLKSVSLEIKTGEVVCLIALQVPASLPFFIASMGRKV